MGLRRWLGIGLGLLGCSKSSVPAFPLTWEAHGVHELSARVRRVEHVAHRTADFELVIDSAEIDVSGTRAPAPVRIALTPASVKPGLTMRTLIVGEFDGFAQSIDLAAIDASGNENARLRIVSSASGAPQVLELRPFGK
jgi:predicted oxidoreductase